jgi:hypothetical protein
LALSGAQVTRLWPYGGPGHQYGSFAGKTAAPPAPEVEPVTPAGRRKRRRYYVEIDGQQFEVESAAEAQALLERARALAERAAEEAATKLLQKRKPETRVRKVTLLPPRVSASPELQLDLGPLKRDLTRIFENAAAMAELQLLLRKAAEEDDEEAVLWLM